MPAGKNPEPRKNIKNHSPFNYKIDEYILLPDILEVGNSSFFEVLNNRKSTRSFGQLGLDQISTLLWYSAKAKKLSVTESGMILSHRTAPSAGGIHPIDIFVSLSTSLSKRQLLIYDPIMHRLARIKVNAAHESDFFKEINSCLPLGNSTLIWFGVSMADTALKYKNHESLVWRDAGALLMTFQLVTTALKIASCPVGTLGEPFLSKLLNDAVLSAGGLVIG